MFFGHFIQRSENADIEDTPKKGRIFKFSKFESESRDVKKIDSTVEQKIVRKILFDGYGESTGGVIVPHRNTVRTFLSKFLTCLVFVVERFAQKVLIFVAQCRTNCYNVGQ